MYCVSPTIQIRPAQERFTNLILSPSGCRTVSASACPALQDRVTLVDFYMILNNAHVIVIAAACELQDLNRCVGSDAGACSELVPATAAPQFSRVS